jgi:tRNA modification GTPase
LNALARRDVAIVSDEVGTTRDAIEVRLNVSGYPVIFTDTAGLRETSDSIEKKGIDVTYKKILESNLVLELFDNPTNLEFKKDQLVALNKCDQVNQEKLKFKSAINISAKSGEGIEELLGAVSSKVKENFLQKSSTVPTKTRYILGVQKTVESLLNAKNVNLISQTELIAEELRLAINEIGRLTGAVDVEEYLEVIFRDFCIGK